MKRFTRRQLAFVLALLLLLTIFVPANAEVVEGAEAPTAKMEWDEALTTCTMFLRIPGDRYTTMVPIEDASIVHIQDGGIGVVTWPAGNCATQTPVLTATPSTQNYFRLDTLALELEYEISSMSSAAPDKEFYVIDAGLPDGKYSYGIECTLADGEWWISRGQSGLRVVTPPSTDAEEGEIWGMRYHATALKMIVISLD